MFTLFHVKPAAYCSPRRNQRNMPENPKGTLPAIGYHFRVALDAAEERTLQEPAAAEKARDVHAHLFTEMRRLQ